MSEITSEVAWGLLYGNYDQVERLQDTARNFVISAKTPPHGRGEKVSAVIKNFSPDEQNGLSFVVEVYGYPVKVSFRSLKGEGGDVIGAFVATSHVRDDDLEIYRFTFNHEGKTEGIVVGDKARMSKYISAALAEEFFVQLAAHTYHSPLMEN